MAQRLLAGPTVEPVTLAEAKAFLRLESNSPETAEDALVTSFIVAARQWAEGVTRRAFVLQTWAYTLPAFPPICHPDRSRYDGDEIDLPLGRCLGVQSITYVDTDGTLRTLGGPSSSPTVTAAFRETLISDQGGVALPAWGETWPATRDDEPAAVTVTFRAGYGPAASDVPASIRTAILYRVADLYEHRGSQDGAWTSIATDTLHPYALRAFD